MKNQMTTQQAAKDGIIHRLIHISPSMSLVEMVEKSGLQEHVSLAVGTNRYLKGIEHLGELFQAILYRQVLCLEYQSYRSEIRK